MHTLVDKTAIVIGGANGIGASIVKEFLKENVKHIAVVDIDEASGIKLEKEMLSTYKREKITFYNCDVTNIKDLFQIYENVADKYGPIDVVVNGASIAHEGLENFKLQIETNYTGVVSTTLKALEMMRKDNGGIGGTIINVTSYAPLTLRFPSLFVYGSTQSAILQFANCMGMQEYYKTTNVRLMTICFQSPTNKLFNNKIDSNKSSATTKAVFDKAAEGVVQSYKNGGSGSAWVLKNNKVIEITEDIRRAYKVMSTNVTIINNY